MPPSLRLKPEHLVHGWEAPTPTVHQLTAARRYFQGTRPQEAFTAVKLVGIPISNVPEVAFFGRSNVGKSSLLNEVLGAPLCRTSSKPGRTRAMHGYTIGGDRRGGAYRMQLLDMPGYGHGSLEEWGSGITRYLQARRTLKRAFLLVDVQHGLKDADRIMLECLRHQHVPHQVILSKIDRLLEADRQISRDEAWPEALSAKIAGLVPELRDIIQPRDDGLHAFGQIVAVSGEIKSKAVRKVVGEGILGIDHLRWAIMVATGMDHLAKDSRQGASSVKQ